MLLDPDGRRLIKAPPLPRLFSSLRIETLSHGDTGFYRAPEMLAPAERSRADGPFLRWLATVGPGGTALLVFRNSKGLRIAAYEGSRRWDTAVPFSFAPSPLLVPGSRRLTFFGSQSGSGPFLPYALPLVDRIEGRIAGRFGLDRIELGGKRTIHLAPVFDGIVRIEDASANGGTVFALVDLEREKRIVRIRGEEIRSWRLCEKKDLRIGGFVMHHPDFLPEGMKVERSEVGLPGGKPARGRPFGLLFRPERPDGRLAVWLHGGPTATLADRTIPREVRDLIPLGVTVLAVEQSGMVGGGIELSERLPRLGHEALRRDMAAVTQWVRRSGYQRAFLIADSFGGASAAVAASEHAGAFEHIFLRAPFLRLRAPEQSVDRRSFGVGPTPPESQRAFEEMVFGGGTAAGRARFAAALAAATSRLRPSPRLSFYFGSLDPVSAPSDLPDAFAGHPSVMVLKTRHEFLAHDRKVWGDILAKLDGASAGTTPAR